MSRLVLYEDEHLLVINKPAGWNTHSPSPYAGEGVYDWLRHREPRWASLAIIHRLDKETSGLLVFSKTTLANRSLTQQFTQRAISKEYRLATTQPVPFESVTVRTGLRRRGERYEATATYPGADIAETQFRMAGGIGGVIELLAVPITGKTHQIRVHAATRGFPLLGDQLYGGAPADRLCLHAERLTFVHPESGATVEFHAPARFAEDVRRILREAVIDPELTDAFRLLHGAREATLTFRVFSAGAVNQDGRTGTAPGTFEDERPPGRSSGERPGRLPLPKGDPFFVDRLGEWLLAHSTKPLTADQREFLRHAVESHGLRGAYHKSLRLDVRSKSTGAASPSLVLGSPAPEAFPVRENGLQFEIRFDEGYSVGLFLDQRDNRRRLLVNHVAADFPAFPEGPHGAELLNVFAYTCGFSVAAAKAGARTTSLDLSRKYLEWGRRNFALNGLDPAAHDFIYGDAFDWLRRLGKKGRRFDVVLLDPPTFSSSKESGTFRAGGDYRHLVEAVLPVLKPGGLLFCSTNAAQLAPERFVAGLTEVISSGGRTIAGQHYAPQPPDFPISREEPGYLKTIWLRLN